MNEDIEVGLGWEIKDQPWARTTMIARVALGCRWPYSPSALRGAVIHAIADAHPERGESAVHSDWNGRREGDGDTLNRLPPVLYRVRGRDAALFLWGPRTGERLAELGRVASLVDPENRVIPLNLCVDHEEARVSREARHYYLYETVTPWWPPARAWARRPRGPGSDVFLSLWASESITGWLHGFFRAMGIPEQDPVSHTRIGVDVLHMKEAHAAWHRDDRDIHINQSAYHLRFVSNVMIPSGIGIGKHGAEGYGEVTMLHDYLVPK